ncbi:MAG: radical SAM protein [Dehalococcoidaceae bacterium]|nr:radical SAM protein [Dehalococcoidaceae bacterium]
MPEPNDLADLKLVAWEITRSCNLYCAHCRAASGNNHYPGELATKQCFTLIDQIAEVGKPILILTGGEPLLREDVFEIGRYAVAKGFKVVIGTNGTLLDAPTAKRVRNIPVSRISISLDFPVATLQDKFRGKTGAFTDAIAGIRAANEAGIEVQINSTITKMNIEYLPALVEMALGLRVAAFHPFMLVPTGRGKELAEQELSPEDYEKTLKWICAKQQELGERLFFKPTDAPHYQRIMRECGMQTATCHPYRASKHPGQPLFNTNTRGCLAGTGFCFISHTGRVQGCGYFDLEAGNILQESFASVWHNSPLFNSLRDINNLKGKCGRCEYQRVCGGCRARAYEATGDYLAEEPYCIYQPKSGRQYTSGQVSD